MKDPVHVVGIIIAGLVLFWVLLSVLGALQKPQY